MYVSKRLAPHEAQAYLNDLCAHMVNRHAKGLTLEQRKSNSIFLWDELSIEEQQDVLSDVVFLLDQLAISGVELRMNLT